MNIKNYKDVSTTNQIYARILSSH